MSPIPHMVTIPCHSKCDNYHTCARELLILQKKNGNKRQHLTEYTITAAVYLGLFLFVFKTKPMTFFTSFNAPEESRNNCIFTIYHSDRNRVSINTACHQLKLVISLLIMFHQLEYPDDITYSIFSEISHPMRTKCAKCY